MTGTPPADQFQVTFPDGYRIERLPVGRAHDAWHLVFIGWAEQPFTREEMRRDWQPLSDGVLIEAVDGTLEDRSAGGHGNNDEYEHHERFTAAGVTAVRVTYRARNGDVVATEEVPLTAA